MKNFKNKVINFFKPNEWRLVEYPRKPKLYKVFLLLSFLTINSYFWKSIATLIPIVPYLIMLYFDLKSIQIFLKLRKKDNSLIEKQLRYVIHSNKLFDEEMIEVRENQKVTQQKVITRVIQIFFKEDENKVYISISRTGDRFTGLEHEETVVGIDYVDLTYMKKRPERLHVLNSDKKEINQGLKINLGYGITYSPVEVPHLLLVGGTGSGKSVFISWWIIELLKMDSTLYIADPKNSDLGSLSHYLGTDRVATTPNNIARIIRLAVEEMQKRYEYMNI